MKNQKITTYQMAVTAVMAAVLCVLGPLTVPIGAIPISLANFVICLTAWLLGPKFGTLSVVLYLALGTIGIPVFSGYGAGLAKVAGPTGGYIVGYLLIALFTALAAKRGGTLLISAVMAAGLLACYALGTGWFMVVTGRGLAESLALCVLPFVIPDACKAAAALLLSRAVRARLRG